MCHAICDRIELLLSVRDARLESSEPDADSVDQATRLETVPVSMSDEDYSEWLDGEDDERADEDQVTAEIDDRAFAASCSMDRQSYSEWAR